MSPIVSFVDSFLTPWDCPLPQEERGKELPTDTKSDEEIAKFTVDENLTDVERAVKYLQGGHVIQHKQAIASLPSVIQNRGRQGWDAIAQPLKSALSKMDKDAQVAAAEAFMQIAKGRYLSPSDVQTCLLPLILRNINKQKSEEETEAWLLAMMELVPVVDKECVKTEILPLALSKGEMDEISSKCICAQILGAIAPRLTKDEVEKGFLKKALAMCQDVEYEVRISTCSHLGSIGRTVGKDVTQKQILDEILELLKDEEVQVRDVAFSSLVALLDLLSSDCRKAKVMPIMREHMRPFELDIVMQRSVAKNFGRLITLLKPDMDSDDMQVFYGCFKHLCAKSDIDLRTACASQIAHVLKAATSVNAAAYSAQFHDTLYLLAADSVEDIRLSIAGQMHELAPLTGGRDACCSHFVKPLVRLLRDESQMVQAALLPHLNLTLQYFVMAPGSPRKGSSPIAPQISGDPARDAALNDILRALVDLEARANLNWRLQASLATTFPSFPRVFSSDAIHEHFIPMAFRFLSHSVAAVRPIAAEGMASFLRFNRRDRQRAEHFLRVVREYARGKSFIARLAFVDLARHIVQLFSSRFIKDWVFDLCLELLYDPVPNVRLTVAPLLPFLKQAIKLPEDVDQLERLNNAVSNTMNDNDKDVSTLARSINNVFKKTPVRMGGGAGMMDMNGLAGGMSNYEAEDKKREMEEQQEGRFFTTEDAQEIRMEILQLVSKKKSEPLVAGKKLVHRSSNSGIVPGTGPAIKQIAVMGSGSATGHRATSSASASVPRVSPAAAAAASLGKPALLPARPGLTTRTSAVCVAGAVPSSSAVRPNGSASTPPKPSPFTGTAVLGVGAPRRTTPLPPGKGPPAGSARVAATALQGRVSVGSTTPTGVRPSPPVAGPKGPVSPARKVAK